MIVKMSEHQAIISEVSATALYNYSMYRLFYLRLAYRDLDSKSYYFLIMT